MQIFKREERKSIYIGSSNKTENTVKSATLGSSIAGCLHLKMLPFWPELLRISKIITIKSVSTGPSWLDSNSLLLFTNSASSSGKASRDRLKDLLFSANTVEITIINILRATIKCRLFFMGWLTMWVWITASQWRSANHS